MGILTFCPQTLECHLFQELEKFPKKIVPKEWVQFPATNLGVVITEWEMIIAEVGKGAQGNGGESDERTAKDGSRRQGGQWSQPQRKREEETGRKLGQGCEGKACFPKKPPSA